MVSNSTTTKKETPYQAIINDIIIQKNEKVRCCLDPDYLVCLLGINICKHIFDVNHLSLSCHFPALVPLNYYLVNGIVLFEYE